MLFLEAKATLSAVVAVALGSDAFRLLLAGAALAHSLLAVKASCGFYHRLHTKQLPALIRLHVEAQRGVRYSMVWSLVSYDQLEFPFASNLQLRCQISFVIINLVSRDEQLVASPAHMKIVLCPPLECVVIRRLPTQQQLHPARTLASSRSTYAD